MRRPTAPGWAEKQTPTPFLYHKLNDKNELYADSGGVYWLINKKMMKIKKADFYEENGSGIPKESLIKEVIDFNDWPIIIGVGDDVIAICNNEDELRAKLLIK